MWKIAVFILLCFSCTHVHQTKKDLFYKFKKGRDCSLPQTWSMSYLEWVLNQFVRRHINRDASKTQLISNGLYLVSRISGIKISQSPRILTSKTPSPRSMLDHLFTLFPSALEVQFSSAHQAIYLYSGFFLNGSLFLEQQYGTFV